VSEIDINLVQLGQEVVVTFDAILAKEYHGQIVDVAPIGNTDTGIPSFTVTVELADADEEIRLGMTSEVSIITREVANALLVPNRAIRLLDGDRVVYVLRDAGMSGDQQSPLNSIVPVPVTLGATSDFYSEVLNGDLTIGDKVILNPPSDGIASKRESAISVQINP
jgi:multidrug efflux pump subunit AcrA (membrane-fusion protein)